MASRKARGAAAVPAIHVRTEFPAWHGRIDLVAAKGAQFMLMFGRPGVGKSVVMQWVASRNVDQFYLVTGMSEVPDTQREMRMFLPRTLVHETLDLGVLDRLYQNNFTFAKVPGFSAHMGKILVLADDGTDKPGGLDKVALVRVAMKGRHARMTFFLAIQNFMAVPRKLRGAARMLVVCKENDCGQRDKLFNNFFKNIFDGKRGREEFDITMNEVTKDYGVLVYDDTEEDKSRRLKRARADNNLAPFKMNHRDIWLQDAIYYVRTKQVTIAALVQQFRPEADAAATTIEEGDDEAWALAASTLASSALEDAMEPTGCTHAVDNSQVFGICFQCKREEKEKSASHTEAAAKQSAAACKRRKAAAARRARLKKEKDAEKGKAVEMGSRYMPVVEVGALTALPAADSP